MQNVRGLYKEGLAEREEKEQHYKPACRKQAIHVGRWIYFDDLMKRSTSREKRPCLREQGNIFPAEREYLGCVQ